MIRITRKRLIVIAVVLFLIGGAVAITWEVCDWPPVRLILKYGLPPAGGLTGRIRSGPGGREYVEVLDGYCRAFRPVCDDPGDALGRLCARLGIPFGRQPEYGDAYRRQWVQVKRSFWVATEPIPANVACKELPSKSDRHIFAPFLRRLTAEGKGRVRLPSEGELFVAAAHGTAGSRGYALASAIAPDGRSYLVLYGSGWSHTENLSWQNPGRCRSPVPPDGSTMRAVAG